jgi:hypothetical protein
MTYAELSFQFAKEIATQLITLSSALIAVSVTFLKDFRADNLKPLRISWGLYIVTIVCGVWTLMTLTGTLEGLSAPGKTFTGFAGSTRAAALAQIVAFIAATISLVVFGWSHALERQATGADTAPPSQLAQPPSLPDAATSASMAAPPTQFDTSGDKTSKDRR